MRIENVTETFLKVQSVFFHDVFGTEAPWSQHSEEDQMTPVYVIFSENKPVLMY